MSQFRNEVGDSNDTRVPLMVSAGEDWERTKGMTRCLGMVTMIMVLAFWIGTLVYMVSRPATDPNSDGNQTQNNTVQVQP